MHDLQVHQNHMQNHRRRWEWFLLQNFWFRVEIKDNFVNQDERQFWRASLLQIVLSSHPLSLCVPCKLCSSLYISLFGSVSCHLSLLVNCLSLFFSLSVSLSPSCFSQLFSPCFSHFLAVAVAVQHKFQYLRHWDHDSISYLLCPASTTKPGVFSFCFSLVADVCKSKLCLHKGTCTSTTMGFTCQCQQNFIGNTCSIIDRSELSWKVLSIYPKSCTELHLPLFNPDDSGCVMRSPTPDFLFLGNLVIRLPSWQKQKPTPVNVTLLPEFSSMPITLQQNSDNNWGDLREIVACCMFSWLL